MVLTALSMPVTAQNQVSEKDSLEETWEIPSVLLHRQGATVTANIQITKACCKVLFVAPGGFRPLYNVGFRKEYEYVVSEDGRRRDRDHVTRGFSFGTDGTVRNNGVGLGWDFGGISGTRTIALEWITATEEESGEFHNVVDRVSGVYQVAKGESLSEPTFQ